MKHYRIEDQTPLKTQRLLITPMSARELSALIEQEQDALLKSAYEEMRRLVLDDPDQALWHTGWRVALRQTGEPVGLVMFHGVAADKTVEIGYGVDAAHRGNGYAKEAVKRVCDWAFSQDSAYFIQSLTEPDNDASIHILEKLKFYRVESAKENMLLWELERPASSYLAVYMSIGLALGISLGSSFFGNMATGLAIGLSTGVALGVAMDAQDRKARKREHEPKRIDPPEDQPRKR